MCEEVRAIGVDGCKGGWVCVYRCREELQAIKIDTAENIIARFPNAQIAVDIPIGLTADGHRGCDQRARNVLQGNFKFTVFRAPPELIIEFAYDHFFGEPQRNHYQDANELCHGLSQQTYFICGKIKQWHNVLSDSIELQERVFEVHPEVIFMDLNGGTLAHTKHRQVGRDERAGLLHINLNAINNLREGMPHPWPKKDDILDAFAALTVAEKNFEEREPLGDVPAQGYGQRIWR